MEERLTEWKGLHVNINNHDVDNSQMNDHIETGEADSVTMPLGTGGFGDAQIIDSSEVSPRKFSSGALVIVLVVVVAAIGLFSMRTLTRVSAGGEPEVIEQSIDEFIGEVLQQADTGSRSGKLRVLDVLNESYAERQVPVTEVKRNPFILFEEGKAPRPSASTPEKNPIAERKRARTEQFAKAAERLRINMVMMGSNPMATVNNRIVRVGDMVPIDDYVSFRVVSITSDRVDFIAEDAELDVKFETTVVLRRN